MSEREKQQPSKIISDAIRMAERSTGFHRGFSEGHETGYRVGYREGFLACREAAAKVARGDVYKERYRTWPFREGDRSNENEITKHSDDIANAIEALTPGER